MQDIRSLDLKKTFYNLSYKELFERETDKKLKGLAKGIVTEFGAVTVDTGQFTGRSPKDKYVVAPLRQGYGGVNEQVWWAKPEHKGSDNKPVSMETWDAVYDLAADYLFKQKLYVMDGWCGASEKNRVGVRVITPIAWQAHFSKNMFIPPSPKASEGQVFPADWVVMVASEITIPNWQDLGLNSEVAIIINLEKKMIVICGTWYGGEIKKGMFSVMNYELPIKGVGSFHCSANEGKNRETALFFGLSGTGKTTLSADPKRKLIGDDEHGWDDEGIFNFEGGCYAKVINLSKEKEPDIYKAIKRDALLENVVVDPTSLKLRGARIDFTSAAKTENTRMGYPLNHIKNIVKSGRGKHPNTIVFLTCDSFGVLPAVAKLTIEQAMYWYLSGYTAKVAGTERGVTEPAATFSSCFGGPFLTVHPTVYAKILGEKIKQHGSEVYLVNTGWVNGGYGAGKRMDIAATRVIIDRILDNSLKKAEYEELKPFGLMIPKAVKGVESQILNPKNGWSDKAEYERTAERLASSFIDNFKTFTDTKEGKELEAAGPHEIS
jgi:phosphoenolpyruvate carboxykinase (ATP)